MIATVSLNNYLDDENIFTIVYKAEKRVISYIIIKADSVDNRVDTKELGFLFLVNADYQVKGIRSETIPLILNYLFSNSIWKVYAGCFRGNKGQRLRLENLILDLSKRVRMTSRHWGKNFILSSTSIQKRYGKIKLKIIGK